LAIFGRAIALRGCAEIDVLGMPSLNSTALRRISVFGLVTALTVAACEVMSFAALRLVRPEAFLPIYEERLVAPDGRVTPLRRNLDWRWRTAEFDVTIRTNSEGFREDFQFDLADVAFAFMGDSFTFGQGVEASERYTNLFAARLKGRVDPKRVVSLGRNDGFQPEHYEYFLRKHPELRPQYIVVGLYLGNDLESDIRETRFDRQRLALDLPYRRIEGGQSVSNVPFRIPGFRTLTGISSTARLIAVALNRTAYRNYLFADDAIVPNTTNSESLEFGTLNGFSGRAFDSLSNIDGLARERGGRLVVMLIPQNFYAGPVKTPHLAPALWPKMPEIIASGGVRKAAIDRCRQSGLACVDAGAVMTVEDFFASDAHWNRAGHRKAADLLYDYFSANEGWR
jgi:hypothetical protein